MEYEGIEQEILLEPENAIVGAVYSVNGKTGDVVLTTSDLENDSDYQTGDEVGATIATAIAGKQDTLTAGNNIQISDENVISATDTTYSAGNGLNLSSENAFSVDTTVVATQQNLATEVQNRENADNALQAQIDGISASSDVVDIVGTYADLQNYDTSKLKDNDIIKVLQDSTQNNATTYYRWSTSTDTFTLIGQEGPYYTKAAADAQFVPQTRTVNGKALSTNITLNASDVSALGTSDVVQTTGTSTSQVMSQNATTQALGTKLNITDYVVDDELKNSTNPVQNGVLYGLLGNMPTDFFSGNATATQSGTEAQFTNALKISDIELNGDTVQQTYSGKNLAHIASINPYNITATLDNGEINCTGTMTAAGALTINLNTNLMANTTYSISLYLTGTISGSGYKVIYMNYGEGSINVGNLGSNITRTKSFTPTTDVTTMTVSLDLANGTSFTNYNVKIQIESGSTATSYEPYVGGTASPNPDYPQAVQVVTGEQTVEVHGKNLYTTANAVNVGAQTTITGSNSYTATVTATWQGRLDVQLEVPKNTDMHFHWQVEGPKAAGAIVSAIKGVQTNTNLVQNIYYGYYIEHPTSLRFNTGENTEIVISLYASGYVSDAAGTYTISNLQLETGLSFTSFEPYQGQDYTVNLGSLELAKIGNYQDYIYKSGDDWYVHKEIGKVTLDGTVGYWNYIVNRTNVTRIGVQSGALFGDYNIATTATTLYSEYFKGGASYNEDTPCAGLYSASVFYMAIPNSIGTTAGSITQEGTLLYWINQTKPSFYLSLKTPTDTQITDSTLIGQLNALYTAKMLAGQTNFAVSAVSPNLPAILDITMFNANAQGIIANIRSN